ncbi:hypothetical protein BGW38_003907, partial [Lunasporangiospora selenospora]
MGLIALAGELAKHQESYQRVKGSGGIKAPRSVKKPTVWQRQNTGISNRSKRFDQEDHDPDGEAVRKAAMKRKAAMYERLQQGEELPDEIRKELLIEFEFKEGFGRRRGRGRSASVSASERSSDDDDDWSRSRGQQRNRDRDSTRPRDRRDWEKYREDSRERIPKDDPWVEHVDEYGRSRLVRQSEIPRPEPLEDINVAQGIHNPANPFPVFINKAAAEKKAWIQGATADLIMRSSESEYSEANMVRHYDDTRERRTRAAGFYAFSQDEEKRAQQMRELKEMRSQTENNRATRKSLKEKRREDIEARKRLIEQKRLKSLA